MTPRELFGVVVRSIGLLMLISAVYMTVMILNLGLKDLFLFLIFQAVPTAALGVWMLRGPALIIDFAYPDRSSGRASDGNE